MEIKGNPQQAAKEIDLLLGEGRELLNNMWEEKRINQDMKWRSGVSPGQLKSKYSHLLKVWIDKGRKVIKSAFLGNIALVKFDSSTKPYVLEKAWPGIEEEVLKREAVLVEFYNVLSKEAEPLLRYNRRTRTIHFHKKSHQYKKMSRKSFLCNWMFNGSFEEPTPVDEICKSYEGESEIPSKMSIEQFLTAARNVNKDTESSLGIKIFRVTSQEITLLDLH